MEKFCNEIVVFVGQLVPPPGFPDAEEGVLENFKNKPAVRQIVGQLKPLKGNSGSEGNQNI